MPFSATPSRDVITTWSITVTAAMVTDRATATRTNAPISHSEFRPRIYGSMAALTYANRAADVQRVTRIFVNERRRWLQLVRQAPRVVDGPL